jgi:hypothetical protein
LGGLSGSVQRAELCSGRIPPVRATGARVALRGPDAVAAPLFLPISGGKSMRNLLALLAMALITLAVLGWYLNWYKISSTPSSGGHRQVEIDLNTPKIGHDVEKGGEKVRKMLEKNSKKDTKNAAEPQKTEPILPASN